MTEIEMKAHVEDPAATLALVREFAVFQGEVEKLDAYWMKAAGGAEGASLQAGFAAGGADRANLAAGVAAGGAGFAAGGADRANLAAAVAAGGAGVAAGGAEGASLQAGFAAGGADRAIKVRIREERTPEATGETSDAGVTTVTYKRKEVRGNLEINDEKEFSVDNREAFEALLGDLGFSLSIEKRKQTKSFVFISDEGSRGEIPVTIEVSLVEKLGWFIELEILASDPDDDFITRSKNLLVDTLARAGIPESAIESRFYTDMLSSI